MRRTLTHERRVIGGTGRLLPPGPAGSSSGGVVYPIATNRVAWVSTFYGDDTTHLTTGGTSKIQQFVNQDTSVAWAQGTAANQFSWEADSLSASMNGLPSGHPDGGDFYFTTEAAIRNIVANNTPFTIFAVASADVVAAAQYIFGWGNSAAAIGYRGIGFDASGVFLSNGNDTVGKSVLGTTPLVNKRPYVFALKSNGTQSAAWIDAVVEWALTTQSLSALTIDRASLGSRPRSTNDIKHVGQVGELLLYNVAMADADIVAQSNWLYERWQLGYGQILSAGDSLSTASNTVSGVRLENRLTPTLSSQRYAGAVNGRQTSGLISVEATEVTPRARSWTTKNVITLWAGTNDLALGTAEADAATYAANTYARLTTLISDYHALNYKVVILTCLPRPSAELCSNGVTNFNAAATLLNTAIIGNAGGADSVVDVAQLLAAAGLNQDTAPNSLSVDGTHITDLAYTFITPAITTAANLYL